jgi:predicted dehydrogenase
MRDGDVDIALILTPPDARASLIAPLAQAGKAILLEKPVGRNLAEAEEVVRSARRLACHWASCSSTACGRRPVAALALVRGGTLGALGLAEISVPWWREQAYYDEPGRGTYARDGGGVLISQAIHTIDLALTLTGPGGVRAGDDGHQPSAPDGGGGCGRLRACASPMAGWAGSPPPPPSFPGRSESITLHFEKASLHLAEGVLQVHWRDGRTETHGATATTGGGADPMAFTHDWHMGAGGFRCCRTEGVRPRFPAGTRLPPMS